jgi:hypothetical protein
MTKRYMADRDFPEEPLSALQGPGGEGVDGEETY